MSIERSSGIGDARKRGNIDVPSLLVRYNVLSRRATVLEAFIKVEREAAGTCDWSAAKIGLS
jgi:hypothetical protein